MAIRLNEDQEMVKMVKEGLKRTGGYCPCRMERSEENKCICKEFREQMADPSLRDTVTVCCITRIKKFSKFLKKAVDKTRVLCYYTQALSEGLA